MKGIVAFDYAIQTGGPVGEKKTLATFRKGQRISLKRVSKVGDYPAMYTVAGYRKLGRISWAIVQQFVRDFY